MDTDMDTEALSYDVWIEDALRGVIVRALNLVASRGLPGDHHFYISFKTAATGVHIPPRLYAENPEEMTIVLQYQFEDLVVGQDGFSVRLSFQGRMENLHVPYAAITSFADPSVNFGVQMKTLTGQDADEAAPAPEAGAGAKSGETGEVIALDAFRNKKT